MWPFAVKKTTVSPFGVSPIDDLGSLDDLGHELALTEIVSRRPLAEAQPNRAFVGNTVGTARYVVARTFAIALLSVVLGRAAVMQIVDGAAYRQLADANRIRTRVLPASRGIIVDRNGTVLAKNTPAFTLVGDNAAIPEDEAERGVLFARVAELVGGDAAAFALAYADAEGDAAFPLMLDVPYERALAFATVDDAVDGVDIVLGEERAYRTDTIASLSHVLGYTGVVNSEEYAAHQDEGYARYDRMGKQGIEAEYEAYLRGTFGRELTEVDAEGKSPTLLAKQDAVNGQRLTLSLDVRLQEHIEDVIEGRLQGTESSKAAVVAMDPRNGEILALVSWPAYDANLFAQGIGQDAYDALIADEDHPLFPRAVAGEYPSGSTIKPVYAAAALSEGIITPSTTFLSTGGLQIGDRFFPDWRAGGHGSTNVYHAIADSVNTFFYYIGGGYDTFQGLGVDKLMTWAAAFGFGAQSGMDLPSEADGFLPSKTWKEQEKGEQWYIGDTYNVSIGQGDFLVSPVQVTRATAVFANGGQLVTPHLALSAETLVESVVDSAVAEIVRQAMRRTVTSGSATSLQSVPVEVAGKTGTAQWSRTAPPHSWFTGFAPYDNPSMTLTVIVEDGGNSSLAIPIAREVLMWYFANSQAQS